MSKESNFISKLICILLLLHHGFQKTNAIIQYKPQQAHVESKPQHTQENMSPQQQIQQPQPAMQQQTQIQHQAQQALVQSATNMQERDATHKVLMKDINQETDLNNHYKMINEIKRENHPLAALLPAATAPPPLPSIPSLPAIPSPTWNTNPFMNQGFVAPPPFAPQSYQMPSYSLPPFSGSSTPFSAAPYQTTPIFSSPKFFPFMGYPQPVFIPYPPFLPPEYFYSPFSGAVNEFEDITSRAANGRRPPIGRDSPIYYMRLPPAPYMFVPNFGFPTNQNGPTLNYGANFPPIIPYQTIPTFPGLGQTFNLPVNFLANGKPTGIHSFIPDIQNSSPFSNFNGYNPRPQAPSLPGNYFQSPYNPYNNPPPPPYQDSKLTSLKQPFFFNGRPEDIYVLQNSLNQLFSGLYNRS